MGEKVSSPVLIFKIPLCRHNAVFSLIQAAPIALTRGIAAAKVPILSLTVYDTRMGIHAHMFGLTLVGHGELCCCYWHHALELYINVTAASRTGRLASEVLIWPALFLYLVRAQSQGWGGCIATTLSSL